ncbi:hypothetical protein BCF50_3041 [Chryseobacterium daecheongense]|uniref:Glycosyltransferase RgtA/B/C/D-like domain-containing protein n=2 Tax=Chryseobacterium daecheongense TaxID=192389 RepID=A0A3N0VSC5_9FLAO|nr:hypothetical protein EGI05_14390 [Chryseobacterium daecheongense]TDX91899.1 hypothetical protein BCF50_3041 [Chryseobacterium daecheongense]
MKRSLLITIVLFFGMCLIYIMAVLLKTENYFTYILDDAYIHLAMAKNVVFHKVWGVTNYNFSSSSSSPVFTLLLSGLISIFGNQELIPLIFNFFCSFFIAYFLDKYYSGFFSENISIVTASVFTLLFVSVHLLVFSGMEHVLHVLLIVINVFYFERWKKSGFKDFYYSVGFYGPLALLGLVRFESMFYFLGVAFVFFLLKKFKEGIKVLFFGFTPILIFGYFTYSETGYFFPNSVLLKGTKLDLYGNYLLQLENILRKVLLNKYFYLACFFPLLFVGFFLFKDYRKKIHFQKLLLSNFLFIVFTVTLLIHGVFGQFTDFFRYEGYILVVFVMAGVPKMKTFFVNKNYLLKENRVLSLLVLCLFTLMIYRMNLVNTLIITGSQNIYEQQIQSTRFLKKYYNNSRVIANDIGAICYFTDIHLLDIAGLGSKEIIPFRMKIKGLDSNFEKFLTDYSIRNHFQLAIVYEEWLKGYTPKSWKKIAVLKIKGTNAVLGKDHLSIYAVNPQLSSSLKENIKSFHWNKNVDVRIIK